MENKNTYEFVATPESSNIKAFSYIEYYSLLVVEFKSDHVYSYANVPISVFIDMKKAESKGKYFNEKIKGKYTHSQIN